jgi:hypothetical protein
MGIFLVLLTALAGGDATPATGSGFYDIDIDVVNTWQAPYASEILDLTMTEYGENLLFRSNLDGTIFIADPDDGSLISELIMPEVSGFGLVHLGSSYYINSDTSPFIYHSTGSTGWESFPNPAGVSGSGMSNDPDQWNTISEACSQTDRRIYSFDYDGSGEEFGVLPGVTGTLSGIAAHWVATDGLADLPYAIIATSFDQHEFFFYFESGGVYYQYGQEPCPVSVLQSLGLAFAPYRSSFFWSYIGLDGEYYVSELFIPVLGELDSATWGAIKGSFQD